MKKLEDPGLFEEKRALPFQQDAEMRFVAVKNEYHYVHRNPADFREDMLLTCKLNCRTRTWKGYYFHRVNPPFLNIGVIRSGEQLLSCNGEYMTVEKNDVLILPPDNDYELLTPVKCEKIGLIIYGRLLKQLLAECGFDRCKVLTLESVDYLDDRFAHLGRVMEETRHLGARREASTICYELIQYLASPEPKSIYPAPLAAALELINEQYAQNLSLADIAAAGGVSESGIARLFRSCLATTPHRYLTAFRMHQAEAMLRERTFLVKEVAARVGYDNALNFSTVFRKFFGYPPKNVPRH